MPRKVDHIRVPEAERIINDLKRFLEVDYVKPMKVIYRKGSKVDAKFASTEYNADAFFLFIEPKSVKDDHPWSFFDGEKELSADERRLETLMHELAHCRMAPYKSTLDHSDRHTTLTKWFFDSIIEAYELGKLDYDPVKLYNEALFQLEYGNTVKVVQSTIID